MGSEKKSLDKLVPRGTVQIHARVVFTDLTFPATIPVLNRLEIPKLYRWFQFSVFFAQNFFFALTVCKMLSGSNPIKEIFSQMGNN